MVPVVVAEQAVPLAHRGIRPVSFAPLKFGDPDGNLLALAVELPHASGNRPPPRGVKAIMRFPVISRRAFLLAGTICRGLALPEDGEASPFLEVPKQLYALGEVVFFWVGVKTSGVVPRGTWSPGVLHIIRPDGARESQKIGGPIDGDPTRGWRGGASLGRSPVIPGLYRLSFEWGQKQSPEAQLTVLEWDLRDRVLAHWVFQGSDLPHSSVTLEVKNRTDQLLRFIRLGAMGSHVWVHSTQGGPTRLRKQRSIPRIYCSHRNRMPLWWPWRRPDGKT